jgi:single-stranded-DNA-specific exonuclease
MLIPEIEIDAEIDFADITPKLTRILKQFEPFGPQNMTPVFLTKNVKDTGYAKKMGTEDEHLKLFVKQNNSEGIPAIGFGLGDKMDLTTNQKPFEAVYCIDENEWNGKTSTQLRLKNIR